MEIERDGKIYEVIDETETDYQVEIPFEFESEGTKLLKLWWSKKYCKLIREKTFLNAIGKNNKCQIELEKVNVE